MTISWVYKYLDQCGYTSVDMQDPPLWRNIYKTCIASKFIQKWFKSFAVLGANSFDRVNDVLYIVSGAQIRQHPEGRNAH